MKFFLAALALLVFPVCPEGKTMKVEKAIFAGGCFWCMLPPFQKLDGVQDVVAGYTGGQAENPDYESVSSGKTGHYEAVEVLYDPSKVSYKRLLDAFWQNIDPTDENGQFVDRGTQYRTAVFYLNEEQRREAERSREELGKSGKFDKPIMTGILKAGKFYKAEQYHQDYPAKNPSMYKFYKERSGRDQFLEKKWKKQ
jgi:peptide methionine sulfoxide reductase msrA/msrB